MKPENQNYIPFYDDEHHFTSTHMNSFIGAYGLWAAA